MKQLLFTSLITFASSMTFALDFSDTAFERAAKPHNIDPALLYSLSLIESAKATDNTATFIAPAAFVVRDKFGATYHTSRDAAEAHIEELLATGEENFDVGAAQINYFWHKDRVEHPNQWLDKDFAIQEMASILAANCKSLATQLKTCIGRYHTWSDPVRANNYADRVLAVYNNIRALQTTSR